jgi:SAM-dependent methyltransferase
MKLLRTGISKVARRTPLIKDLVLKIAATESGVERLRIRCSQMEEAVVQSGVLPLPPEHLQRRVVGVYAADFISSGARLAGDINNLLSKAGTSLGESDRILDFGCGPGRVLRALHFRGIDKERLFGTDIDSEAIDWCTRNYARVANFAVNNHEPPTPYPDDFFDCIYSISVFTHLPEEMQFAWLAELKRIVKPAGYLILTFHGANFGNSLSETQRNSLSDEGFVYESVGGTEGLPSFYQNTLHTEEYVRREWAKYFDVLHMGHRAIDDHQDGVLCQKVQATQRRAAAGSSVS